MPRSRSSATIAEAHRLRLDLLLKRKRYDDVIRSCDALIARGKATPKIYELRGLARSERKDFPGAIEDVTNAMALRPDRAALLSRRGWLYIVSDAPKLALHDFQAAIQLDPSIADAYNGRGFARLRLGEHRDAVADAEKALGIGEPDLASVIQRRPGLRPRGRRRRGRGPEEGSGDRDPGGPVPGPRHRVAPRGARSGCRRDQRASFWRDVVPADPALRALRRRVSALDASGDGRKSPSPPGRGWPKAG